MINTILGSKLNMSHRFQDANRVSVTVVKAGPCVVTQIKNMERDGYWAVQLGFADRKLNSTSKSLQGHFKKASIEKNTPKYLREIRLQEEPQLKPGDKVSLSDIFSVGDTIQVTGISKGKGFAGGVKRWGFAGGSKTHGQSDRHRAPGSIGQGTTPGRVYKGKKMAGRMGTDRVTIENLKVVEVSPDENTMAISGSIPGHRDTLLIIRRTSDSQVKETQKEETNE